MAGRAQKYSGPVIGYQTWLDMRAVNMARGRSISLIERVDRQTAHPSCDRQSLVSTGAPRARLAHTGNFARLTDVAIWE